MSNINNIMMLALVLITTPIYFKHEKNVKNAFLSTTMCSLLQVYVLVCTLQYAFHISVIQIHMQD